MAEPAFTRIPPLVSVGANRALKSDAQGNLAEMFFYIGDEGERMASTNPGGI
jgi:hypothetical protein